jgi:hypothetical protein
MGCLGLLTLIGIGCMFGPVGVIVVLLFCILAGVSR